MTCVAHLLTSSFEAVNLSPIFTDSSCYFCITSRERELAACPACLFSRYSLASQSKFILSFNLTKLSFETELFVNSFVTVATGTSVGESMSIKEQHTQF
jgi:hypothetical protein